jgi:ribonucleases P/MRP protein subunit RPP40
MFYTDKLGVLSLELDKQTYERCGLQGEPIRGLGRVHQRQRFRKSIELQTPPPNALLGINVDLRSHSMVPGKRAFDRLIYACSKVLVDKISWLYLDLEQIAKASSKTQQPEDSIKPFCVKTSSIDLQTVVRRDVFIPAIFSGPNGNEEALQEADIQTQLLEYIGLLLIDSRRTFTNDKVDPILCVYTLPGLGPEESIEETQRQTVAHVRCHGLLPLNLVRKILGIVRQASRKEGGDLGWWTSRVATFEGNVFVAAHMTDGHSLEWEIV